MTIRINQPLMIITYNNNSKEIDNQENDNQEKTMRTTTINTTTTKATTPSPWVGPTMSDSDMPSALGLFEYMYKLTLWANQKVYFVHWTEYVLVLWCGPLYEKMQNTKSMILLNVLHTEQIRYLLRDVVVGCRWPAEGILEPPLLVISYCNIIKIKIKARFNTKLYICIWCTRSSNSAPNVEVSPKKYTSPLLEASS